MDTLVSLCMVYLFECLPMARSVHAERCTFRRNKRHGIFLRGAAFSSESCTFEQNGGNEVHSEEAQAQADQENGGPLPTCAGCGATFTSAKVPICGACGRQNDATRFGKPEGKGAGIPGDELALPDGWQAYTSPDGNAYYHHAASGATQWQRPKSSPPPGWTVKGAVPSA
eukprot:TRINITY_DN18219_c0_g1_i5.p1 TRINITY_DN18219_c0_g1~~TRINITY_DN18219_c0_g1_i5.p1  ORF type:complete len:170 (+),score=14.89 TRINITY_DN18219_c0_g1_i5:246-755(+)